MKSWRLKWAWAEISNPSNFYQHGQTLRSSWKFWFALIAKFIPRLWAFPIQLHFKQGGVVNVMDFMSLYIYKEIFVDRCYDYPPLPMREPVIIDVGANIGLFAIRMKQLYPHAHVFCYEPFPSNYDQLKKNLEHSRCDRCYQFKMGVGGTTRKERLFVHPKNIGGHSIYKNQSGGKEYIDIELVDVHEALRKIGDRTCDLLKLDCEGAEYEILKSIDKKMAQRIARILFEPTPGVYNINEILKHLENVGYQVKIHKDICVCTTRNEPLAI